MPRGRYSLEAAFTAKDKFSRPLARMQTRMGRFARATRSGFAAANRLADNLSRGVRRVGLAAAAAGVGIGLLAKNVIDSGAGFEEAMSGVAAVMLKPKEQLGELASLAKELGATTKFTATEAASGMEIMARAGFKTEDIMSGITGVLNAAAASGLELAEVSDHVSNVLKGMGLETSEAGRVADVLALASSRTNSSIGSLGESVSNVASTARQLKIPLEDVVAGVAALQDVGLDASVAGSAMNTMLTKLAAPSDALAKKLKKMGVQFKDANGNALPFADIIGNISKASKAAGGNMDQVAILAEMVGLRGQKAASNLAELFETGKLEALTAELQNAKGSAEAMGKIRMDNFRGDVTLLGSAVDAVKTSLFETQSGPLRGITQGMTKWVGENQKLITQKVERTIALIRDNSKDLAKWGKRVAMGVGGILGYIAVVKTAAFVSGVLSVATDVLGVAFRGARGLIRGTTAAIGFLTAAETRNVVWTFLSEGAQKAKTAALWLGRVATMKLTGAIIAEKAATIVSTAMTWGRVAAQWAYNFVVGLGTKAIALFRGAQIAATGATVVATGAIGTATAGLGAFAVAAGVAAAAVGGILLAMDQLEKLDKETSGLGFWGLAGEMWDRGTWDPAKALSDYQDEQARKKARDEGRTGPGSTDPQVVSPQERVARSFERSVHESRETQQHDIMLHDPTGRAEVRSPKGSAVKIQTARSSGAPRGG